MTKGLKFAIGILAFGCLIPLITAYLTLKQKPVYHTQDLSFKGSFVQFTWQEKPVANLEHILIFFEKPEKYQVSAGLDVRPPYDVAGYSIYPRGVFYDNAALLQPVKKVLKRQKKDVRTWVIHKGKAFPIELTKENAKALNDLVANLKVHSITQEELTEHLTKLPAWLEVTGKFAEFKQQVNDGKIDFTPRKRRSEFMTF